jgi:cullin 1
VKKDLEKLYGQELLIKLDKKWTDHQIMVKWMQKFFQYLDRFYVEMESITKLHDQGFKIFKEIVFKPQCNSTTEAIINEIQKQREGQ